MFARRIFQGRYREFTRCYHDRTKFARTNSRQVFSKTRIAAQISLVSVSGYILGSQFIAFNHTPSIVHADTDSKPSTSYSERQQESVSSLLRAYFVYSACSIPLLVDWSPTILHTLLSIPGIKQATSLFVRHTFFAQVCYSDIHSSSILISSDMNPCIICEVRGRRHCREDASHT